MKHFAVRIVLAALAPALITSCMTTYDAQGNPVQSVDPAAATAIGVGAAAAGYAAGRNSRRDTYYYRGRPYYWHHGRRVYY